MLHLRKTQAKGCWLYVELMSVCFKSLDNVTAFQSERCPWSSVIIWSLIVPVKDWKHCMSLSPRNRLCIKQEVKYTHKPPSSCIISTRSNFHLKWCNFTIAPLALRHKFGSSWETMQTRWVIGGVHSGASHLLAGRYRVKVCGSGWTSRTKTKW